MAMAPKGCIHFTGAGQLWGIIVKVGRAETLSFNGSSAGS